MTMDDTQTRLVRYFAAMLRVPQSEVRTDVSVLELGADSIMLVEAQRWLRDEFGCEIEVKAFFENLNSIQTIAAHVALHARTPDQHAGQVLPSPDHRLSRNVQQAKEATNARLSSADYSLMQSQLALALEVIEQQNNLMIAKMKNGTAVETIRVQV